jgi:hypothetical protein
MTISRYGVCGLKIESRGATLLLPGSGKEQPRDKGTIVALSTRGETPPKGLAEGGFLIDAPGEYDIQGLSITALPGKGARQDEVSFFMIAAERHTVCFMPAVDEEQHPAGPELSAPAAISVLALPVDGSGGDGTEAARVVTQLEPSIVVPLGEHLSTFLKEMGAPQSSPQKKLVLKEKDVFNEEDTTVTVLE